MALDKITIKGKEIDIMKELSLDHENIEVQKNLAEKMADIVLRRSILKALELLSEEEAKDINESSFGDIEKTIKMLDKKITNFDKILSEQIVLLQDELLNKK
ncbi:hypothetical protein M0Q50_04680 [bacterium]|jgi:aromatic ring hydroxylase|nr:hypothetical protein [bacterium]